MEIIVWKEINITSIISAANYRENQFFQKDHLHLYLRNISLVMNNKSTNIQVYNESKKKAKIS